MDRVLVSTSRRVFINPHVEEEVGSFNLEGCQEAATVRFNTSPRKESRNREKFQLERFEWAWGELTRGTNWPARDGVRMRKSGESPLSTRQQLFRQGLERGEIEKWKDSVPLR